MAYQRQIFLKMFAPVLIVICGFWGCEKNPVEIQKKQSPTVNQQVEAASKQCTAINQIVNSTNRISDLLKATPKQASENLLGFDGIRGSSKYVTFLASKVHAVSFQKGLAKVTNSDTLLWEVSWKDSVTGISYRQKVIYLYSTGEAEIFRVAFDYPEMYQLAYDSIYAHFDLNSTLDDTTDDRVHLLFNYQEYKSGFHLLNITSKFVPDEYAIGEEPKFGYVESTTNYNPDQELSRLYERIEFHADNSGVIVREMIYWDGTNSHEQINFFTNGTGTFTENKRDGTRIEGTFNSIEDDNEGGFTKTTTYPAGHDPLSMYEEGHFTRQSSDSTISGSFTQAIFYVDGNSEIHNVTLNESIVNGVKTTKLSITNSDGTRGEFTIVESSEGKKVDGATVNHDGTYLIFSAFHHTGGSATVDFALYPSKDAYENGDDPILTGHFRYNPDGAGRGIANERNKTYEIEIRSNGHQSVSESN